MPGAATLRPPSERDLEIYKRRKILGQELWEIASDFQIHYSRASQIVSKVYRWLAAGGAPSDPLLRDHVARQRLSYATLKLRLQRAVELATCAMEARPSPHNTTRRRLQGPTEVWREETTRDGQPVNLPAVRLVLRTIEALRKLEEQEPFADEPQPTSQQELLTTVFDFLCGWRARAEAGGRIGPSPDVRVLVARALNELLGTSLPAGQPLASTEASNDAKKALNLSAEGSAPVATNSEQPSPCEQSASDGAEKSSKIERPADAIT
jgi:hypothetical protein